MATLNALIPYINGLLYFALFLQAYILIRFIRRHTLMHEGVIKKIRTLSYIFTVQLVIKFIFFMLTARQLDTTGLGDKSNAYINGYYTGYYTKTVLTGIIQHTDII